MNCQLIADLFNPDLTHVLLDSETAGTIQANLNGFTATNTEGKQVVTDCKDKALHYLKTGKEPKPDKQPIRTNQLSLF